MQKDRETVRKAHPRYYLLVSAVERVLGTLRGCTFQQITI